MRGRSIVIAGPDGAGKSALADVVVEGLGGADRVRRFHHRAPILPRRTQSLIPVTEPHAKPPYGRVLTVAKIVWLFIDMQLMWRLVVPRATRRGIHVVVERGWWDLVVDPRRYRLASAGWAARLGRLLPAPDLEVVLGGDAAVMAARKAELPMAELERQLAAWQRLRPAGGTTIHLDAAHPIDALAAAVLERVGPPVADDPDDDATVGPGWAHLPPWAERPRWQVPRGPRHVARAALRVYQPVTRRAAIGWGLAGLAARFGGFRLLPGHPRPDLAQVVAPALPSGAILSSSAARKIGRGTLLAMDRDGRAISVVKVARDLPGSRHLVHEADIGERLRVALPAPLSGPKLLSHGDGFLLFEAVDWVTRSRPWELPDDVAWAMGRFHRAGRADGSAGGYTHGDFAPWNLLRTADGWSLVDWADARVDGPAFEDPFHYLVQSHALLGRPRGGEILAGLRGEGRVGAILRAYAQGAGLDLADAPRRMRDYLETSESALTPGDDEARGRRARARLRVGLTNLGS